MTRRRLPDPAQGDLLDWRPPVVVERYDERRVRSASLRDQVARAIAVTLQECGRPRPEIAAEMSAILGEEVPVSTLDAYASQAKFEHTISYMRLVALCEVTGDTRLLQLGAERCGRAIIEERYVAAVEAEMLRDKREALEKAEKAARKRWKGGR